MHQAGMTTLVVHNLSTKAKQENTVNNEQSILRHGRAFYKDRN